VHVGSFGGPNGCMACAVNLVNMWCALICSPNQGDFMRAHDPPNAVREDDLNSQVRLGWRMGDAGAGVLLSSVSLEDVGSNYKVQQRPRTAILTGH
jgi:hypothetical protein